MLKIVAAFLAPIILYVLIIFSGIFSVLWEGYFPQGFLNPIFVYIYAFPAYLLIGVPVSIIIERFLVFGNAILYYILGGVLTSLVLPIFSSSGYNFSLTDTVIYIIASLTYYITLVALQQLDKKLIQNKKVS